MNFGFLSKYYSFFIEGAMFTIILAFFTVIFGTILGSILSLMKLSKNKILKFISSLYIEVVRGTPILVQLYIIYYGLPSLGIHLPDMIAAVVVITLSLNSAAYVAEIVRAGIDAVDKGQSEAARSLGMSKTF